MSGGYVGAALWSLLDDKGKNDKKHKAKTDASDEVPGKDARPSSSSSSRMQEGQGHAGKDVKAEGVDDAGDAVLGKVLTNKRLTDAKDDLAKRRKDSGNQ